MLVDAYSVTLVFPSSFNLRNIETLFIEPYFISLRVLSTYINLTLNIIQTQPSPLLFKALDSWFLMACLL